MQAHETPWFVFPWRAFARAHVSGEVNEWLGRTSPSATSLPRVASTTPVPPPRRGRAIAGLLAAGQGAHQRAGAGADAES